MSNKQECLKCRNTFTKEAMHIDGAHGTQLCIGCHQAIRKAQRAEKKRHKKETVHERTIEMRANREARKEVNALMGKAKPVKKQKAALWQAIGTVRDNLEMAKLQKGLEL